MLRQSPRSRNGRNKGLKIKHVLQISVLLCVSVWLLYQVHHSDDKKTSVTTDVAHKLRNVSTKDLHKLGRKDLRPKVAENNLKNSKESEEDQSGEQGNENEDENENDEIGHDHESDQSEDMKHDESGENEESEEKIETEHGSKNEMGNKGNENDSKKKSTNETGNEQNKVVDVEKMGPKPKEVEIPSSYEDHDEMVRNVMKKIGDNASGEGINTNPGSYSVPFVYSKARDMEQVSNVKDDVSVYEEENDALTGLGTLPDSETGGSINHDNSATK